LQKATRFEPEDQLLAFLDALLRKTSSSGLQASLFAEVVDPFVGDRFHDVAKLMDCRIDGLKIINADGVIVRVAGLNVRAFCELETPPVKLGLPRPAVDKDGLLVLGQRPQEFEIMRPRELCRAPHYAERA
jgi:hypothetical protein